MTSSLASCSNDDVVPSPENPNQGGGSTAYAKVNITMGGSGSRAISDSGFESGTKEEGAVNSITLVLYNEAGTEVVAYGTVSNETPAKENGTDNVSDKYDKTVELTMLGAKEDAKKVIAYINTTADITSTIDKALKNEISDFGESGAFAMTSAGLFNGENWTVAADIADGSIYDSQSEATSGNTKTTIYVERLAAKVTTSIAANVDTDANYTIYGVDGKEYELEFDTDNAKWAPTQTATSMYTLKNPWTETLEWAEGTNRSFWAAGVNYTATYVKDQGLQNMLDYVSSKDLISSGIGMGSSDYTMEHTYGQSVVNTDGYNALGAATSVILLGQYKVKETTTSQEAEKFEAEEGEGYDFYLLLTDSEAQTYTIYTKEELMQYLLENSTKEDLYDSESGGEKITKDNVADKLELIWDGEKASYTLEGSAYIASSSGGREEFKGFVTTNARHYNLGYTYFFIPIEHNGGENAVRQYGVVRNHSYKLNITEIKNLGAPLDDDHFGEDPEHPGTDDPIKPDPKNPSILKAEINVLSWHVVDQNVKL